MNHDPLQEAIENGDAIVIDTEEMTTFIQKRFEEKTGRAISLEDVHHFLDAENDFLVEKGIIEYPNFEEAGE